MSDTTHQLRAVCGHDSRSEPIKLPLTDEQMQALVKECGLDWQRGYMPLFDDDPTNRYAVLIEAAIGQATAELRAERDALVQATGSGLVLEAIQIIRANIAALAKLARYETLRPASEHDGETRVYWHMRNGRGEWSAVGPYVSATGTHFTPLPDVKEATK